MVDQRTYYSARHGRGPASQPLTPQELWNLVLSVFHEFERRAYFQQYLGYYCVDAGAVDGLAGSDMGTFLFRKLRWRNLWPFSGVEGLYEGNIPLDLIYDVVELLHDIVGEPTGGRYHDYSDCGYHATSWNRVAGQAEFRTSVNEILRMAATPMEVNADGHIVELIEDDFVPLTSAVLPPGTDASIEERIASATTLFRERSADNEAKRLAVLQLIGILENLRQEVNEGLLSADDKALSHLANKFDLRHSNREQRGDYNKAIWLRWAFYVYLATIHALLRVIHSQSTTSD